MLPGIASYMSIIRKGFARNSPGLNNGTSLLDELSRHDRGREQLFRRETARYDRTFPASSTPCQAMICYFIDIVDLYLCYDFYFQRILFRGLFALSILDKIVVAYCTYMVLQVEKFVPDIRNILQGRNILEQI